MISENLSLSSIFGSGTKDRGGDRGRWPRPESGTWAGAVDRGRRPGRRAGSVNRARKPRPLTGAGAVDRAGAGFRGRKAHHRPGCMSRNRGPLEFVMRSMLPTVVFMERDG